MRREGNGTHSRPSGRVTDDSGPAAGPPTASGLSEFLILSSSVL